MGLFNSSAFDVGYPILRKDVGSFLSIRDRSKKQMQAFYQGVDKNAVISYISPSGTTPGVYWIQKVKLLDLKKLIKANKGKLVPRKIVEKAIQGDIQLSCNDPSWLFWGFKYKGTIMGYSIDPENRYPKIRNPKLQGSVCKHLDNVLLTLPFHTSIITRDLIKKGFFI